MIGLTIKVRRDRQYADSVALPQEQDEVDRLFDRGIDDVGAHCAEGDGLQITKAHWRLRQDFV